MAKSRDVRTHTTTAKKKPVKSLLSVFRIMLCGTAIQAVSAGLVVYDDFSSGDLSKFELRAETPQRTDPVVVNQELVWSSSKKPAYGVESLISTKNDFNFTATAAAPLILQFDLNGIDQKTGDANNSYDDLRFGFFDTDGHLLEARLSLREAGTANNESALQFAFNDEVVGRIFFFSGLAYQPGDTYRLEYDGSTLTVIRKRDGSEDILGTAAFEDEAFGGSGSIYLAVNLEGVGDPSFTIDNVAVREGR